MSAFRSPPIAAVCDEYFGTYHADRNKWSPPNRCDSCPLRAPCMTFGAAPSHTQEQLDESRVTFRRDALALLGVSP